MSEDRFLERLREDARALQYEPADDATWTRLAARIGARVQSQPSVAQLLSAWLRPIGLSFAALAVVATVSIASIELTEPPTVEAMETASVDLSIEGELLSAE